MARLPRFIPAWAGNAYSPQIEIVRAPVHPRVGGERTLMQDYGLVLTGSSPRGRGTPYLALAHAPIVRFIPAWAGNARISHIRAVGRPVHPRVGGERRAVEVEHDSHTGSSPRGRGTRSDRPDRGPGRRFIPAWAGNANDARVRTAQRAVHPRVGGERVDIVLHRDHGGGSSPRGRGTRAHSVCPFVCIRFIPAWAGNACELPALGRA